MRTIAYDVIGVNVFYSTLMRILPQKNGLTGAPYTTPFHGVTLNVLTPILTPNLGSFLHLKKSSFDSENGVDITPYLDCVYSFWSYFNSES